MYFTDDSLLPENKAPLIMTYKFTEGILANLGPPPNHKTRQRGLYGPRDRWKIPPRPVGTMRTYPPRQVGRDAGDHQRRFDEQLTRSS